MIRIVWVFLWLMYRAGCASYRTSGAGVDMSQLYGIDDDIADVMQRESAAPFPTNIAIAKAQSTGYHSRDPKRGQVQFPTSL